MRPFQISGKVSMKRLISVALLTACSAVYAEDAAEQKAPEWHGDAQFGLVSSNGNTENTNINGKVNVKRDDEQWAHNYSAVYYSSSEAGSTTAERFKLEYQADYKLSVKDTYWFVNSSYEEDRFGGFEYRATLTTGYGRSLYNANDMTLDAEIGAGLRASETEDATTFDVTTSNEAMIRFAAKYNWDIAEDRKLVSALAIEEGEETRVSNFEIGFVTMIAGDFSLKAAYEARHVSEVPVGNEKLDTVVSLNVLYTF